MPTRLGGAVNTVLPKPVTRARWVAALVLVVYPLSASAQVPDVGPGRCYGGCGASAPSGGGGYGGGDAAAMAGAQMMMGIFNSFVNGMNQARQAQRQAQINRALALNDQGIKLYHDGQYGAAINAFQQAVALKPDDVNMQNNLRQAQQAMAQQHAAAMSATTQRVDAMLGTLDAQMSRQDAASKAGLDFAGGPAPAGTSFFGTGGGPGSPRGGSAAGPQAGGLDFATDNENLFSKGYHGSAPPDLRGGSYAAATAPSNAGVGQEQDLAGRGSASKRASGPPQTGTPSADVPPPTIAKCRGAACAVQNVPDEAAQLALSVETWFNDPSHKEWVGDAAVIGTAGVGSSPASGVFEAFAGSETILASAESSALADASIQEEYEAGVERGIDLAQRRRAAELYPEFYFGDAPPKLPPNFINTPERPPNPLERPPKAIFIGPYGKVSHRLWWWAYAPESGELSSDAIEALLGLR